MIAVNKGEHSWRNENLKYFGFNERLVKIKQLYNNYQYVKIPALWFLTAIGEGYEGFLAFLTCQLPLSDFLKRNGVT
jgi:hypothetical protein